MPAQIRVRQRLLVRGKGDYQLAIGGPIDDALPAPGSQSTPGLRTDQLLWAGFSPGRKVLAADVLLRPRAAAQYLPVRLRLQGEGDRTVLTVKNATAFAQPTPGQPASPSLRGCWTRRAARPSPACA